MAQKADDVTMLQAPARIRLIGVALSGDGKRALTGAGGGSATLWDTASGKMLRTFEGDKDKGVLAVALSGDGKIALTVSWARTAFLWDADSGKKRQSWTVDRSTTCVALSRDGKLVLAGAGRAATLWDPATGAKLQTFEGIKNRIESVALSGDG